MGKITFKQNDELVYTPFSCIDVGEWFVSEDYRNVTALYLKCGSEVVLTYSTIEKDYPPTIMSYSAFQGCAGLRLINVDIEWSFR